MVEEGHVKTEEFVMEYYCNKPGCVKHATSFCPTCTSLGIPRDKSSFCSRKCYAQNWQMHKKRHVPSVNGSYGNINEHPKPDARADEQIMRSLTPPEKKELDRYPIGCINKLLSAKRLVLRRSIAINALDITHNSEWWKACAQKVKDAFIKYPPYKFYMIGDMVIRIYGTCVYNDGLVGMHAVSCQKRYMTELIGGIPLDGNEELVEIENWDCASSQLIGKTRGAAEIFFDPLSWELLVRG